MVTPAVSAVTAANRLCSGYIRTRASVTAKATFTFCAVPDGRASSTQEFDISRTAVTAHMMEAWRYRVGVRH